MFADAIEAILESHCTPSAIRRIEAGGDATILWNALTHAGFLELLAPEAQGGAHLSLAEFYPVLNLLGRYAVPAPVAQTMGARILAGPEMKMPVGMMTLANSFQREPGGGATCRLTPFGTLADYVLANDGEALLLLPCATAQRSETGVWHSQTATLTWRDMQSVICASQGGAMLAPLAGALHAGLLAGAMSRTFDMTLQYCNTRQQFGRTLSQFQAVQHQLSIMAEHMAAASIAAEAAFPAQTQHPALMASAMAKARTSEAASLIANIAHALHGAIGVTEEYDLQLFTRRLHEWRMAHGSEAYWHKIVGQCLLASKQSFADFVRTM